jgi:hypothetical protein
MGIPRKGSRSVEVDGQKFRFLVKETHIPDHKDQKELSVTVQEDADRPGRVLQFRLPYGFPVSPEWMKGTVREALKAGWDPKSKGSAFALPIMEG